MPRPSQTKLRIRKHLLLIRNPAICRRGRFWDWGVARANDAHQRCLPAIPGRCFIPSCSEATRPASLSPSN